MSTVIGIGGARRNASSALAVDGEVLAICEQERVTRVRGAGLLPGELPRESMECVLRAAGRAQKDVRALAVAESGVELPAGLPVTRLEHHFGHAATAFWTSPFEEAAILVCDRHSTPDLSVWRANANGLTRCDFPWTGRGFASIYADTALAFGFGPEGQEHRLEALARVGGGKRTHALEALLSYHEDRLVVDPSYIAQVADWVGTNGHLTLLQRAEIADDIQRQLGDLLLEVLRKVRTVTECRHLCVTGGFFYNSSFATLVARSGLFERTFVPINPGNAGTAVGAALAVDNRPRRSTSLSPFLGPEYDPTEIKAVLDNCKLSYDYLDDREMIARTVAALVKGKLVGWFQGRMEWGARALGNRSILANPASPYTLENLNVFLKQREPHRSYGVSVCQEDMPAYFEGPDAAPFMEFEYVVKDPEVFRHLMPLRTTAMRVHTVGDAPAVFRRLLKAFGQATGLPVLVNTSFNGFYEPIVCTPRDAVRVFYGTGLDMAVIGNFVLEK